jgi:hypothetical protein
MDVCLQVIETIIEVLLRLNGYKPNYAEIRLTYAEQHTQ